jgi:hypothetical protein
MKRAARYGFSRRFCSFFDVLIFHGEYQVCWNAVTSTTTDKDHTLRSFGSSVDDGATFVEIRAIFAKDIGPLSMVPSENELVLSPNSMHKVVASFGSDQLKDLQGKRFLLLHAICASLWLISGSLRLSFSR